MKVPTQPLRDYLVNETIRLSEKHPKLATQLEALKERSLARLAVEAMDYKDVQVALQALEKDADELGTDAWLFALGQDLINHLSIMAKSALSQGVKAFPQVEVTLSLGKEDAENPAQSEKRKPGYRTKFGGKPDWIQPDATPICDRCQKAMTFIVQIDSLAHQDNEFGKMLAEKESFMFADVGMVYVFLCFGCYKSQSVVQCG